jgi:hypothetical protein
LTNALAISGDGTTIIGQAQHNGKTEAYIATIPEPASAWLIFACAALLLRRRPPNLTLATGPRNESS